MEQQTLTEQKRPTPLTRSQRRKDGTTMIEVEVREAIYQLANAVDLIAMRSAHEIGTADVGRVVQMTDAARKAVADGSADVDRD